MGCFINDVFTKMRCTPRMPVAAIAEMYLEMKESLAEIAHKYDLSLAQVYGAMAYYYEHQEEIDRHTMETDRLVEEIKENNPTSKFQEKSREITGER
ncbi:MAG: DUF433 domain-containing protein [Moorea sp. SIO2I5]|nr:DUF433 domain-containing protein [Moorena sp. SIO2I5]